MAALEIVGRAARAGLPAGERSYWSMHPLVALETVLPGLFTALPLNDAWRAALFESREPLIGSLYLGVGTLALVAAAAAAAPSAARRCCWGRSCSPCSWPSAPTRRSTSRSPRSLPRCGSCATPSRPWRPWRSAASLLAGLGADAWRDAGSRKRPRRLRPAVRWRSCSPARVAAALAAVAAVRALRRPAARPGAAGSAGTSFCPRVLLRLLVPAALAASDARPRLGARERPARRAARGPRHSASWPPSTSLAYHRSPSPVAPAALFSVRPEVVSALREARAYARLRLRLLRSGQGRPPLEGLAAYRLARMPEGWSQSTPPPRWRCRCTSHPRPPGASRSRRPTPSTTAACIAAPLERLARLLREPSSGRRLTSACSSSAGSSA